MKLSKNLKKLFYLNNTSITYSELENRLVHENELDNSNLWILMLSALVACIGLHENSMYLLIGAMLMAPLMGSIIRSSFATSVFDIHLFFNSVLDYLIQILICIVVSIIYFILTPTKDNISAFTMLLDINIFNVLIALFGGFAEIIGITHKEKNTVIPGVAIATTLLPPLCVIGYGIAKMKIEFILKPLYLFIINTYFIYLPSTLLLLIWNMPKQLKHNSKLKYIFYFVVVLLPIAMIIPLLHH